ncbi:MAG: rhodanese-like domain-containing protein [Patescibacteria group bacterium]
MKQKFLFFLILTLFLTAGCSLNTTTPAEEVGDDQSQSEPLINKNIEPMVGEEEILLEDQPIYYVDLEPDQAKDLIDNSTNLIVVDVSPDYADGHLPGAVNYYLGDGSLDEAIPSLDKNKEYLVYCHVESVSRAGAQKLIDAGFATVYRLDGDYSAWIDAGFPVEK